MRGGLACVLALLASGAAALKKAAPVAAPAPAPAAKAVRGGAVDPLVPNIYEIVIAGALATALGDVAMHPVDTVKTVQQAGGISLGAAIKKLSAKGGIGPFYDGVVPYAIADGLSGAVKFATYEKCKRWCAVNVPQEHLAASSFGCAAVAFIASSVILVPGELLKQRLQAGIYPSLAVGVKRLLTEEGFRGLYTGYAATLVRDVPYTMLELGLYDIFKAAVTQARGRSQSETADELLAAAVTGGLIGLVTNPLDVIKTQMMTAAAGTYASPLAAGRAIFAAQGNKALWAGSVARVAWLMPFTTIYFGFYEVAKRGLVQVRLNRKQRC
ncbi:mitochondrial carrier domain-containing protein [Pelagophyceae sp. CCMP2097]|nr:mitochondrial carrier domain-containing protein [Pelagophyceae sp. CCMP2097]